MRNQICGVPLCDLYFRRSDKYEGLYLFLAAARCDEHNFFFASEPPYSAVPIHFCAAIPSRITIKSSTGPGIASSGETTYKITSIISMPFITPFIYLPPLHDFLLLLQDIIFYTLIVDDPFGSLHDSECGIESCICTLFANNWGILSANSGSNSHVATKQSLELIQPMYWHHYDNFVLFLRVHFTSLLRVF